MMSIAQVRVWAAGGDPMASLPTDDELAESHDLEGLALVCGGLDVPADLVADPRLGAWDVALLAVMAERRMVASEVAARLRPGLASEIPEVERGINALVTRRRACRISEASGGGFFVMGRSR